jgi:hypothetical protein
LRKSSAASARLISALSLSMIGRGVPAGANGNDAGSQELAI